MAEIRQLTGWRLPAAIQPAYEQLLASIGSDGFGATLRQCVDQLTAGAQRLYLFEVSGSGEDSLRYCHCEPRIRELLPAYKQRYQCLDPISALYSAAPRQGDLAMQRIAPRDIASAGFRRRFFDEPGAVERISLIHRSRGGWQGLNLVRHRDTGPFSERELDAVEGLARLALPMLTATGRASAGGFTAAPLEDRFARRSPELTRREREVCARAVAGLSVEATALELGIAKSSVVTLRQRAYRRLGVSGVIELCALVLD